MGKEPKEQNLRARVGEALIKTMDDYISRWNASEAEEIDRSKLTRTAIKWYMKHHPPAGQEVKAVIGIPNLNSEIALEAEAGNDAVHKKRSRQKKSR